MHTQQILKDELGVATRVMTICPVGENKVTFATLLADDNAGASGGFGAVMGSKKLKAIAISGKSWLTPAFPDELRSLSDKLRALKKHIDYEVPQTQARAYSEEESLLWMYSWLFKASAGGQRLEKKQISMPE